MTYFLNVQICPIGTRLYQIVNRDTNKVHSTWMVYEAAHAAVRDLNRFAARQPKTQRKHLRVV